MYNHSHLSNCLGGVRVEVDSVLSADASDLLDILPHADLVVHCHD